MSHYELPSTVKRFVMTNIKSLEQLEVLLLVARGGTWTAERVARELRGNRHSVVQSLELLSLGGLLERQAMGATFALAQLKPELERAITDLGTAYRSAPHRVIQLIFAKPVAKLGVARPRR